MTWYCSSVQDLISRTYSDTTLAVGLAAGWDKQAEAVAGALAMGFGHVEVGSVTPRMNLTPMLPSPSWTALCRKVVRVHWIGISHFAWEFPSFPYWLLFVGMCSWAFGIWELDEALRANACIFPCDLRPPSFPLRANVCKKVKKKLLWKEMLAQLDHTPQWLPTLS